MSMTFSAVTPATELSAVQTVAVVADWIRTRTPAALVRFGEGEGRLLYADPRDSFSMRLARRKLHKQSGLNLGQAEILRIRSAILRAFDNADIAGIGGDQTFPPEHLEWVRKIESLFAERAGQRRGQCLVAHSQVNKDIYAALPQLLSQDLLVTVISCRDIRELLETQFGLKNVSVHQIPSHYRRRVVDGQFEAALHQIPIWPDFWADLEVRITVRERGEVFLIGAGLFGKGLCIKLRERGAIVLDLGSSLDRFVGKRLPRKYTAGDGNEDARFV